MSEIVPGLRRPAARLPCLAPRLAVAAALLSGVERVADVGCDHGLLCCTLLAENPALRCIASDVSEASLRKAEAQATRFGVAERLTLRAGDGLCVLKTGEAEAVALLGMGGTLIARLLDAADTPLAGARLGVFQPMRGVSDLRRYLWTRGYFVQSDRIVREGARFYQVFSVLPPVGGARQPLPMGWPADCFALGYTAFANREDGFLPLAERLLCECEKRLRSARGSAGEAPLAARAAGLRAVIAAYNADEF